MSKAARPDPYKDDFLDRELSASIPELLPYLRPGLRVLDVGCGPGNLTLDVAVAVQPGEVVGIDKNEDSIVTARNVLQERSVPNASFAVMDTHTLGFPDASFDLVFSNTVMLHVFDPVDALIEQKRVTRKGGCVIASGVRDWEIATRYPACPAMAEVWEGWIKGYDAMVARHDAGEEVEKVVFDLHAGRKCLGWFAAAGLKPTQVLLQIRGRKHLFPLKHAGSDNFEFTDVDLLPGGEGDKLARAYDYLCKGGFVDRKTVERAQAESRAWYARRDAIHYFPAYFVAAQV